MKPNTTGSLGTWRLSRRGVLTSAAATTVTAILAACGSKANDQATDTARAAPAQATIPAAAGSPTTAAASNATAAPAAQPTTVTASAAAPAAGTPKKGGTLTYGLSADPPNLDPQVSKGAAAQTVKELVYNNLLRYWRGGKIQPDLAESYEMVDPQTFRFKLRSGVTWHDGSPFTADDVKFSYERILDAKTGADRRTALNTIDKVVVDDPLTVRFMLKQPDGAFIYNVALPAAAIVSKKFVEGGGNLDKTMMGTGPYKFDSREPGVKLTLVKNPSYFRSGLPYLDKVVFVPYPDDNTRVNAMKGGTVNIIDYVPWKDMDFFVKSSDMQLVSASESAFMCLIYNTKQKPFDDPKVRRAFGYAIDRQNIVDTVFFGRGSTITGGLLPSNSLAYDASLKNTYTYDPDKAKSLLKDAGYDVKTLPPLKLMSTSTYAFHQGVGEVTQAEFKKVGITTDLDLPEWATAVERGNKGDFQYRVHGLGMDSVDPDSLTTFFRTGSAYGQATGFTDPEIDKLLSQGRAETDPGKRKDIYVQIEKRLLDAQPFTYLAWREQGEAIQKKLKGYEHFPGGLFSISAVTLEEAYVE
ncbi:MAG: ABC transporter substrate-binding protein [Thermomicrobiales bacterium]